MKLQIILLLTILCLVTTIAENPLELEVPAGESNFTIEEYFPPIYASQLIKTNPEIQSISTNKYGQTFGYLNALGGIGTNFLIESNNNYEIHTNSSTTIKLKY